MSTQQDNLWSAYLDGELTASEAAAFDSSLSPTERERLQAEVRFETAMGEILGRASGCPADVWDRTIGAISTSTARPSRETPWRQFGALAVAAVLMLTAGFAVYRSVFALPAFLDGDLAPDALTHLEIASSDVREVNAYLHDHGVTLTLHPFGDGEQFTRPGHHTVVLLGASEEEFAGDQVAEIIYECCGKPIKVIVAPKSGPVGDAVRKAIRMDAVRDYRTIGGYIAVLVGNHPTRGLLELLSDEPPDVLQHV